jgi:hypothetical protein
MELSNAFAKRMDRLTFNESNRGGSVKKGGRSRFWLANCHQAGSQLWVRLSSLERSALTLIVVLDKWFIRNEFCICYFSGGVAERDIRIAIAQY